MNRLGLNFLDNFVFLVTLKRIDCYSLFFLQLLQVLYKYCLILRDRFFTQLVANLKLLLLEI